MIFGFILGTTLSLVWALWSYLGVADEIRRHNASPLGRFNPRSMHINMFVIVVRTLAMGGIFAIIAHIS